ncbi:MAG TPA: metal-dependent hydrolase [Acidimicrobiales bacterium]|nr:metal-dependent hydrolase [Acidimicrobiales bacterium]
MAHDATTAGTALATATAERRVPTRRMDFEDSLQTVPRHFAAGEDLILSHVAAVLSGVFPDGEDFFVRSVRRFRKEVTDPEFNRQVAGFIGQEAMHGREHRAFNNRLAELGYPTKRVEAFIRRVLKARERLLSPLSNLANTAAAEHFTATLAELLLSDQETRDLFDHDGVRDLFLWHALEESEHKAVAFDVYRAVGGTERMRIWTMKVLRTMFIATTSIHVLLGLLGDKDTYHPARLRRSWKTFRNSPLMRKELWRRLKDYDRPGFHPDDRDNTELVSTWRQHLFGEQGSLNDKLVTQAA